MTQVLVTRSAHQAEAQADALTRRGYTPVLAPCFKIKIDRGPSLDDEGITAYAVSSANGAAALAARMKGRDKRLFTVGDATAEAARRLGFTTIESAAGDGKALSDLIAKRMKPADGAILYACAEDTAYDVRAALEKKTILCLQVAVYAMRVVPYLPAAAVQVLDAGEAKAVLLMSARTASAFGNLCASVGRGAAQRKLIAVCLSEQVAEAAREYDYASVAVAGKPTQEALLDALKAAVG